MQTSVTFLGHHVSAGGKTLSPERIQRIKDLPKPRTKKQMLSFLGVCSYCRVFIPNYSQIEAPYVTSHTAQQPFRR